MVMVPAAQAQTFNVVYTFTGGHLEASEVTQPCRTLNISHLVSFFCVSSLAALAHRDAVLSVPLV